MQIALNGRCIKKLREHLDQATIEFAHMVKLPVNVVRQWEDESDAVLDATDQYYIAKMAESKGVTLEQLVEWCNP